MKAPSSASLVEIPDLETKTPTILTSSQLLITDVDAPICRNVVLARVVGSMSEFRQIIGRGTRLRDDYGKLWFNILDYTGSATACSPTRTSMAILHGSRKKK
ncbi:type I site-specific restriction endonuclease [Bradyrhizobium elkanii]|uniref:hypothetical protein n=1 Tax=Bradyrhizobium japonicum TaxID=375 RepID=UPI001FCB51B0|nr:MULTISPECIES: hypothetical protein [Bradyrhizobium]MCS3929170.1 type I site-specific restriction endonuclease [Bradyrhizobium elkanii]MCS3969726.1 type I site-specific restriction endonuclease [Bradyrhizobium japonicum]